MSIRTQFLVLISLSSCIALPVWGDEYENTQSDLNRSLNDYYHAVKNSPDKSQGTQKKLSEDVVDPAARNAIHAGQKKAQDDATKYIQKAFKGATVKANMGKGPDSDSTSESRVEPANPIMDAKDVPAELVFPGAPKTTATPMPSKSPKSRRF